MAVDFGKAWLVFEVDNLNGGERLLSVLSARKSYTEVGNYIEQMCVDTLASLEEKFRYKNSRKNWPYQWKIMNRFNGIVYCGCDPMLQAIQCNKIVKIGGTLQYTYVAATSNSGEKLHFSEQIREVEIG
jgi:hypothetical protein